MEDIRIAAASPSVGDVNCAVPVSSAAVRALSRLNSTNTPPTSSSTSTLSKTPTSKASKTTSRHRHTHSLGLLTPTASSSSLSAPPSSSSSSLLRLQSQSLSSSSTSLFSLSPSHPHPYHAQHTPLRSSTSSSPSTPSSPSPSHKARSSGNSPLFQRLLQPFVRSAGSSSLALVPTTSVTATADNVFNQIQNQNDMAALHQSTPPPPHMYQNQPSSSSSSSMPLPSSLHPASTTMPTSPPSRSERLLRDALMRDGLERNNNPTGSASASTSPFTSPSKPGHKRRHSHIPTSTVSNPPLSPSAGVSRNIPPSKNQIQNEGGEREGGAEGGAGKSGIRGERKREQYTGSFLFRTAMSSASAGGVSLSPEPEEASDGSGAASGSGSGRRSGRPVVGGRAYYGGDAEGGNGVGGKYHARSASLSPSPVRRRAGASASEQQAYVQRQAALQGQFQQQQAPTSPLQPQVQAQQHPKSPQAPRSPYSPRSQSRDRPSMALPLPMTPHEQVLRARLERVLEVGRVVEQNERARSGVRGQERERAAANSASASASGSGSNAGSRSGSGDVQVIGNGERRGRGGGRTRSSESDRESRDNEVRDEQGGWPWREKGRGSGGAEGEGSSASAGVSGFGLNDAEIMTSPVSLFNSSVPKPAGQQSQPGAFSPQQPPSTPSRGGGPGSPFTPTHGRTRSKTGPASPSPASAMNSPRRSATLMEPARTPTRGSSGVAVASGSASRIPVRLDSFKLQAKTGANGKAVARDGKSALAQGGDGNANENDKNENKNGQEEGEDEEGELRLLTPPPTPPFTARAFSLSLAGKLPSASVTVGVGEYCPSPYKSSYPVGVQQSPQMSRRTHNTPKTGFGLNEGEGPRRPAHAPVLPLSAALDKQTAGRRESSCDESSLESGGAKAGAQRREGPGYFPTSSSGSSSDGDASEPHSASAGDAPFEGSGEADVSSSSHAMTRLQYLQSHPQAPLMRPTFNARKASERCRAIEGYVSFASIEGLGEPPGAAFGDEGEGGADGGGGGGGNNGAGGGGGLWGGWRRLLGVAGSAATGPGAQAAQQEEGVVL